MRTDSRFSNQKAVLGKIVSTTVKRYGELDLLRGIAVLGIFQINIVYFGVPHELYNFPLLNSTHDSLNIAAWFFTSLFVDGSMYGLFSLLFGASTLLFLQQRSEQFDAVAVIDHYHRRMIWLTIFGLIHAYLLLSPMEILFTYGVLGLFLFPFRTLAPLHLALFGVFLLIFGIVDFIIIEDVEAAAPASKAVRDIVYGVALAEYQVFLSAYFDIFFYNFTEAFRWQSLYLLEDQIFDAGGMMLIGMALYKTGVITGARSARFYWLLSLAGYCVALLLRWPFIYLHYKAGFDPGLYNDLPSGGMTIGRIFLVMGHLGLLIGLHKLNLFGRLFHALKQAGRMALTHYVLQTLFAVVLFYGFGLGMYGSFQRYELLLIALLFGLMQMVISTLWLRYFLYGPLEWAWRSLVRIEFQRIRLSSAYP